jgi:dTDP-glucose 4,6-dehydratase
MAGILVLGSNSFAGSVFVDSALTEGHRVWGINRSAESSAVFLPCRSNPRASAYVFRQLDINYDLPAICQLLDEVKPDYLVDFAGQGMVAESWQDPAQWYQTNIVSKAKLHDFLRRQVWLQKYIRISTPEVYGSTSSLIGEDYSYRPSTPYAVSHAAIDMSLTALFNNYGFPVVLTRFANFFGPGQQLYRIVPRAILCALTGRKLPLHGGGTSVRAFIHARDVASGVLAAVARGVPGETYHFSPDRFFSIREVVELICRKLGVNFDEAVEVTDDRQGKDQAYLMNAAKARAELDWQPMISLDQGVEQTITWIRANFNYMKTLSWDYAHKP